MVSVSWDDEIPNNNMEIHEIHVPNHQPDINITHLSSKRSHPKVGTLPLESASNSGEAGENSNLSWKALYLVS